MAIYRDERKVTDEKIHWQVIDRLIYSDGTVKELEYYNTVVNNCSKLIATLMKGVSGYSGVGYWALGSGSGAWSNSSPPSPTVDTTQLVNEVYRKAIPDSAINFLDSNNNVVQSPTNKLEIKLTFTESEANGDLREFAIFGGNASATSGSGIMINHKIHPLIYKTSDMKLERILRLVF